jgi:hypothetical protein
LTRTPILSVLYIFKSRFSNFRISLFRDSMGGVIYGYSIRA